MHILSLQTSHLRIFNVILNIRRRLPYFLEQMPPARTNDPVCIRDWWRVLDEIR